MCIPNLKTKQFQKKNFQNNKKKLKGHKLQALLHEDCCLTLEESLEAN